MLAYLYRLIQDYHQQHGFQPNLLYLNRFHCEYLRAAFADNYTLQDITNVLELELVIDQEIIHPHVAWTHTVQKKEAS